MGCECPQCAENRAWLDWAEAILAARVVAEAERLARFWASVQVDVRREP